MVVVSTCLSQIVDLSWKICCILFHLLYEFPQRIFLILQQAQCLGVFQTLCCSCTRLTSVKNKDLYSFYKKKYASAYSNRLVGHKIRHKARKEETSFILNGGATVQGEGHKDYYTEWSFSPAIELLALHESIISPP